MTLIAGDLDPPNDPLPLIHPELIEWEQPKHIDIPTFQNNDAIVQYLCSINPETCSTSKSHNEALNKGSAKSLSHKMNKRQN